MNISYYLLNKARDYVNFMVNHSFTTLTGNSRATPVKYSNCGKVFRGSSN